MDVEKIKIGWNGEARCQKTEIWNKWWESDGWE